MMLGPCRCQGCGDTVWWSEGKSRRLGIAYIKTTWRDDDGTIHRCPGGILTRSASGGDGLSGATGEARAPRSPRLL